MRLPAPIRNIILIWLGWAIILLAYQGWVQMRIRLDRPDRVLGWTASETEATSNNDQLYLSEPYLNAHVAWDSEFYLAIADEGYDPVNVRAIPEDFYIRRFYCRIDVMKDCYSLANAFFPVYPLLIRAAVLPISLFPLSRIGTLTLAAVIVSLLGTLLAMLSLYSISRHSLGDEGGVRAAFYLLIFPSGFFLAQVYAEGVFLGFTFAALAFLLKRKWGWAALFAVLATWTRPGGAILLLPMVIVWLMDKTWQEGRKEIVLRTLAALSPAISYGAWRLTPLAERFFLVEANFFGRGLLAVQRSLEGWQYAWRLMMTGLPETRFYYGLEFAAVIFGILCCLLLLKSQPALSLFGLAMILFAFTSGGPQGMVRYVLVAVPIFLMLARWGRNPVFDRVWTLLSILIMSLEVILFSFDFWVA